ncbi:MAG: PQQ-binding-like beta-propeller repeat protein [Rickettsiales bacterium]|jgi:outer membrane protein assembly factor BamB|nr:PQQ-binding-like beta-propeller repeat protein [Rickettsiales bacterium]
MKYLPLLILAACAADTPPQKGGRVPIFGNSQVPAADGLVRLERPGANKEWLGESGNSANSIGHVAGRKEFERIFKADIGASGDESMILYPPSVSGGKVFAMDGRLNVSALDAKTGEILWRYGGFEAEGKVSFGAVNADSGRVFALSNAGALAALDQSDGRELWKVDLGAELKSSIAVCGGALVFKTADDELVALDARSGEKLFSIRTAPDSFGFFKGSAPACADGGIIAGFSGGDVYSVSGKAGRSNWAARVSRQAVGDVGSIGDIIANPVISGGQVFVKGYSGPLVALDLASGAELWSLPSDGGATPALSNGILFDVSSSGTLRAVKAETGGVIWSADVPGGDSVLMSPLLVNNRLLVARSDGELLKYDPYTGAYAGSQKLSGKVDAAPVMADATLYVISGGNLLAFR